MTVFFKNARVYKNGSFVNADMLFDGRKLCSCDMNSTHADAMGEVLSFSNVVIMPGLCDVHVHTREPGFSYKETVRSASKSAAAGGFSAICAMPNLKPVPDCLDSLKQQLDIIGRDAEIAVLPYGSITKGQGGEELSDMADMAELVVGYSDDGRGVQSDEVVLAAMQEARRLGKMIVAHCEDNSLLCGGYIHDGEYARLHGHRGICSASEYKAIERDLRLVEQTGCRYHVCHVSAKESVELIRQAKARGLDVSCETAPHYLTLTDMDICEHARFKMNPPIRSARDRDALIEGILDGTVDMIATDHAPHTCEEKSLGLEKSLMGVVGLETSFAVMYTDFVKTGVLTLERLVELMSLRPRVRFDIDTDTGFTVFALGEEYTVEPSRFVTQGRFTPFEGKRVFGRCLMTVYEGRCAYLAPELSGIG